MHCHAGTTRIKPHHLSEGKTGMQIIFVQRKVEAACFLAFVEFWFFSSLKLVKRHSQSSSVGSFCEVYLDSNLGSNS